MIFTNQMIKSLAGAPLTVLVLLMTNRTAVEQGFIRRHTGFSDHTIHDALELLNDYGYVTQTGRYTWQIADGVQQFPLMVDELPAPEKTTSDPAVEESENIQDLGRKICDLNPSSSSRSLTRDLEIESTTTSSDSSQKMRANYLALESQGVREPAKTRLAKLEHVTVELIQYHCASCEQIGQAIYRIEHNWPILENQVEKISKYEENYRKYFGVSDE
jgi:hypothetical protein